MQLKIDDIPICVINLPERTDRLNRTDREIEKFFGPEKSHFLVSGIVDTPPMKGIARAHMRCIQLAKERDWPYVIIMEDDVRFQSERSRSYADEAFNNAPDNFDILLAGVYTNKAGIRPFNSHWQPAVDFCGLHFYVVARKAYERILQFDKTQHIDRWFSGSRKGGGLRSFVAREFFAIQYNGFSDNTGRDENYDYLIQKFRVLK